MAKGLSRKCRFPYDDDYNSDEFGLVCPEPSLTKQSDAQSCDINVIVQKWLKTGQLPTNLNDGQAQYYDVSAIPDYRTCLDTVIAAQRQFEGLPALVRERFHNDPARFLDFVEDPNNATELVSLGLATQRQPETAKPSTGAASAPQNASDAAPVDGLTAS